MAIGAMLFLIRAVEVTHEAHRVSITRFRQQVIEQLNSKPGNHLD